MLRLSTTLLCAALSLASLQTQVSAQVAGVDDATKRRITEASSCFRTVYRAPEFANLKAKSPPIFAEAASTRHFNDTTSPSSQEVRLLLDFQARVQPCRQMALQARSAVPSLASNYASHHVRMGAVYASLARGEITWGQANMRFSELIASAVAEETRVWERDDREPQTDGQTSGNGTGFFVTADGYVITNAHVLRGTRRFSVLFEQRELPLQIVDSDHVNDLALVKIDARGRPIPIAAASPVKGEDAAALGYPAASSLGTELKATFGKINALSGLHNDPRWMQIDTPVQPGSSGGPLLNMRGEVIGIVTASFSTAANVRRIGGAIPQNVNYAVKADYLVPLLQKNIPGKWRRGSGVRFANTAELVRQREPSVVLIVIR